PDGRFSAQDRARLELRSAGMRGRFRRRPLPRRPGRGFHRAARRRADHRRLLRRAAALLPRRHQHPRPDGLVPHKNVPPAIGEEMSLKRVLVGFGLVLAAAALPAATFTVVNTNDSGAGSLRQAILDANGNAGLDTISFNIPGSGVHTIQPLSTIMFITES